MEGKERVERKRVELRKNEQKWNGFAFVAVVPTTKNKVGSKGEAEETKAFSPRGKSEQYWADWGAHLN